MPLDMNVYRAAFFCMISKGILLYRFTTPRNAAGYGRGRSENLSLCRNEKYHFQFSPLLISFVMSCGRGGGLILFSLLRDWK